MVEVTDPEHNSFPKSSAAAGSDKEPGEVGTTTSTSNRGVGWEAFSAVDVDKLQTEGDVSVLQERLGPLLLAEPDKATAGDEDLAKMFKAAQATIKKLTASQQEQQQRQQALSDRLAEEQNRLEETKKQVHQKVKLADDVEHSMRMSRSSIDSFAGMMDPKVVLDSKRFAQGLSKLTVDIPSTPLPTGINRSTTPYAAPIVRSPMRSSSAKRMRNPYVPTLGGHGHNVVDPGEMTASHQLLELRMRKAYDAEFKRMKEDFRRKMDRLGRETDADSDEVLQMQHAVCAMLVAQVEARNQMLQQRSILRKSGAVRMYEDINEQEARWRYEEQKRAAAQRIKENEAAQARSVTWVYSSAPGDPLPNPQPATGGPHATGTATAVDAAPGGKKKSKKSKKSKGHGNPAVGVPPLEKTVPGGYNWNMAANAASAPTGKKKRGSKKQSWETHATHQAGAAELQLASVPGFVGVVDVPVKQKNPGARKLGICCLGCGVVTALCTVVIAFFVGQAVLLTLVLVLAA